MKGKPMSQVFDLTEHLEKHKKTHRFSHHHSNDNSILAEVDNKIRLWEYHIETLLDLAAASCDDNEYNIICREIGESMIEIAHGLLPIKEGY